MGGKLTRHQKKRASFALMSAVKQMNIVRIARLALVNRPDPNTHDESGLTPLHIAAERSDGMLVSILLSMGADPNSKTNVAHGGITALGLAATHGYATCAELLLEAGADVDLADEWGNTPLFKATCGNHIAVVRLLLRNKANPNTGNKWGALPLQYAAWQGFDDCVMCLLDHGADPRLQGDPSSPAPIAAAATRAHIYCLRRLIPIVDIDARDKSGETALVKLLKYCGGMESNSNDASKYYVDVVACAEELLQAGVNVTDDCVCRLAENCDYLTTIDGSLQIISRILAAWPGSASTAPTSVKASLSRLFQYSIRSSELNSNIIANSVFGTGYIPSNVDLKQIEALYPDQVLTKYEKMQTTTKSLLQLSRLTVKSSLTKNVQSQVSSLPVPKQVQRYITYG